MSKLYLGSSLINTTYMGSSFNGKLQMQQELDAWEKVIFACKYGNYTELYPIGYTQELDLGSEGIVNMQVVAHNADELADGSGTAPLTWISKELLGTSKRMNPALVTNNDGAYQEGTGTIGGWQKTEMRTYMNGTVKNLIPENVRTGIKTVNKTYVGYNTSKSKFSNTSADDCWIPSYREIFGGTSYENSGPIYSAVFNSAETRKKTKYNSSSTSTWWLRSAINVGAFRDVTTNGAAFNANAYASFGVVLGFCT